MGVTGVGVASGGAGVDVGSAGVGSVAGLAGVGAGVTVDPWVGAGADGVEAVGDRKGVGVATAGTGMLVDCGWPGVAARFALQAIRSMAITVTNPVAQ